MNNFFFSYYCFLHLALILQTIMILYQVIVKWFYVLRYLEILIFSRTRSSIFSSFEFSQTANLMIPSLILLNTPHVKSCMKILMKLLNGKYYLTKSRCSEQSIYSLKVPNPYLYLSFPEILAIQFYESFIR